ncbi:MAG: outer membrane protein transport protein [Sulfurovum sp.]|uniref:OmpP1/FadL family transporter n=1 Tax=Sulfurovum sp. TaxID=1969726 RepID=UPI002868157B|nr:outer membrane protein transport protein [Sulfurovum sp.]MCO4846315.1 outer membrane protein transport protein [Sulfurovum sp.]
MRKVTLLSLAATTVLMASGYKIPEQSQKSVALSAANVANANGADASYENPANMAFEEGNGSFEFDLGYIHLTSMKFEGTVTGHAPGAPIESKKENFLIPTFYYVSPAVNDFHFGLAMISPAGLSKRWDAQPAKATAEEFTLKTYEINPTVAYKVNDQFSLAVGLRMLYSEGIVKSAAPAGAPFFNSQRNMKGDALDFGYNLALSYRPNEEVKFAATYRSNIDIDVDGSAILSNDFATYSGGASVTIPAPATLNLAAAYTFDETTTVEFVYETTYWSKYKTLDFNYSGTLSPFLSAFDTASARNWDDVNSYRLGVTHKYNDDWILMAGTVFFDTPMPEQTLGFEHPDAKGWAYSTGFRHKLSKEYEVGASFLYADRENRTVANNNNGINGTFSNAAVYYLSLGIEYKF